MKKQVNNFVCPFCKKEIDRKLIISETARINGRKSRRILPPSEASRIAKIRWGKIKEKINE